MAPIARADVPRELLPLLHATNAVMARLGHLLEHQKRFVRDTSHQLRTPRAVLKTQGQSAQRGDVEPAQALAEIGHTVARATELANQMLALAKVEQLRQQGDAPVVDWPRRHRALATGRQSAWMTEKLSTIERVRLDKWLWVARFFKTRGLAADEIGKGRVEVNGAAAKASRELRPGDTIELRQGPFTRTLVVKALSLQRGPASVAQALYDETPESINLREKAAQERRSGSEPALTLEQGRPTKRDRRQLADWNRWSASSEPD